MDQTLFDQLNDDDLVIAEIRQELEARARRRQTGQDPRWWPAIEIAERFNIRPRGSKDSRKRGVRNIMRKVMERYPDVISSHAPSGGYAIAASQGDLTNYQDQRRRSGHAHLATVSQQRRSVAADDAQGQLRMQEVGDRG